MKEKLNDSLSEDSPERYYNMLYIDNDPFLLSAGKTFLEKGKKRIMIFLDWGVICLIPDGSHQ